MADPGTWALILAGTATAAGAIGSIRQGNATSASDQYQAQVADNNAKIAEQNAQYATEAGGIKAQDVQQRGRVQQGKIKAAQAASGIDVNSGSAPMVRAGQAVETGVDAARTEHDAALQAYGYRTQASNFQAQSQVDRMGASNAQTAGYFQAGGTILSGASSLGYKWGSMGSGGDIYSNPGLYDPSAGGPGAGASNFAPG